MSVSTQSSRINPMKSLRLLLALAFAGVFALSVAQAGSDKGECKDAEKCCACEKDKDGKECGKDKECCCAGDKEDKGEKKDAPAEAPKA